MAVCYLDATWFFVYVAGKMLTFTILLLFSLWETAEGWYATWMLLGCYLGFFGECFKQMLIFLLALMAVCYLDATWERSYANWAFFAKVSNANCYYF